VINYVEGDLFVALGALKKEDGHALIPHVANDVPAWGAGFVVPLGRMFPKAKQAYFDFAHGKESPETTLYGGTTFSLGVTQCVPVLDWVSVCNMIAQHGIGGERPLRYNMLAACMDHVAKEAKDVEATFGYPTAIHAPLFGSGLSQGHWPFIEKLIEDCWLLHDIHVNIYYLPNRLPQDWTPPSN
jgi:hypothetical protein